MNKLNKTTSAILLSALSLGMADTAYAQSNPGEWGPKGYGKVLATGDFNGDGYSDQAIANPSLGVRSSSGYTWSSNAGSVQVKYGTQWGLTGYAQVWDHSTPGMPDSLAQTEKLDEHKFSGHNDTRPKRSVVRGGHFCCSPLFLEGICVCLY